MWGVRASVCLVALGLLGGCVLDLSGLGLDGSTLDGGGPGRLDGGDGGAICGDGTTDPGEECDGTDLGGQTCASRGFASGDLACAACRFDESACVACPEPCTTLGRERCGGNERQRCEDDGASCRRWMGFESCDARMLVCQDTPPVSRCLGGDGETCTGPLPVLALPFSLTGTVLRDERSDDHDFTGAGCAPEIGPEVVLAYHMAPGETVRLSEHGGVDVSLSVLDVCGVAEACLDSAVDEDPGLTFTAPVAALYFFVVEGRSTGAQDYDIRLEDPPPGNLCTDPVDGAGLPARFSGSLIDAELTDDLDLDPATCLVGAGPQIVFARDMMAGETARVAEHGGLDTILHVLADCRDGATCLRSEDNEADGLTFTAPADGTYHFVVEATGLSGSRVFDAVLDEPPPGNLCADPVPGGALPASVSGAVIDRDFTDDHSFGGAGCMPAAGPEIVMARALAGGDVVRMRELGGLDTRMHVLRGTCADTTACLRSEDRESQGLSFTAPVDDVYYFVFEAAGLSGARDYEAILDDPPPGNACADPVDASVLATAVSGANIDADFSDEQDLSGPGCVFPDATEVVLSRMMSAGETVRFSETAGVDVTLAVLAPCSDSAACTRVQALESPGLSFTAPAAGRYYFVAEAVGLSGSRAYSVVLEAVPEGQTCADPRIATSDVTWSGSTFTDFTDDQSFVGVGCARPTGAEAILERTLGAGQSVTFSELGSANVVLHVMSGACSDAAPCLASQDTPESLTFVAPSAGTYTFVVEGVGVTTGSYDIRLSSP